MSNSSVVSSVAFDSAPEPQFPLTGRIEHLKIYEIVLQRKKNTFQVRCDHLQSLKIGLGQYVRDHPMQYTML